MGVCACGKGGVRWCLWHDERMKGGWGGVGVGGVSVARVGLGLGWGGVCGKGGVGWWGGGSVARVRWGVAGGLWTLLRNAGSFSLKTRC